MSSIGTMRLLFQAGSRTIAGNLAGKPLYCTLRPPQGGSLPPAGDYGILPPMDDPIYGRVALMAPFGGSGAILTQLTMQKCMVTAMPTASGAYEFFKPDAMAVSNKKFSKPDAPSSGVAGGPCFVISNQPVLGRNCIIVSAGFADLMDGLQAAGGARVTVA